MLKYVIQRILLAILTTFIILSLTFILIRILPVERIVGQEAAQVAYYDEQVRLGFIVSFIGKECPEYGEILFKYQNTAKQMVYYYKAPVMSQYVSWLRNIFLEWDWGTSLHIEPNVKATVIIGERIWFSMRINIISVLISVPCGIALGILAALKKNTMTDHIISTGIMFFIAVPSFILVTFLVLIFCYNLNWFPTAWPSSTASSETKFLGYIIPVFCLSIGSICGYCRFTRAELCDVLESDYLLLARTKGLTRKQAIVRHALKNSMVPMFPGILSEIIFIFSGSYIVEILYGIPGLGKLFLESIQSKDYTVMFVDMAIMTVYGLLAGVLLDLSYGFIDPRIRMGARK